MTLWESGKYLAETSNKLELRINHVQIKRAQPIASSFGHRYI